MRFVKFSRFLDHAGCDVVADKSAAMTAIPQEGQKITEPAAQVDDRALRALFEKAQELPVSKLMRVRSVPVHALGCGAVRPQLRRIVFGDLKQDS